MVEADNHESSPSPETEGPRVVVGVDGSEASTAALAWALEEARLRHATVVAVHAWQYPFEMAAATFSVPTPAGEMLLWAKDVIEDALKAVEADEQVPVVRRAEYGPAVTVLMEAARGAELLVVGTRGHSRVTGLFLGSVSQYLAVHAPCPVLVVHGPGRVGEAHGVDAVRHEHATAVESPGDGDAAPGNGAGGLEEIPEHECVALLAGESVGRLAVVHDGTPQVIPVNFVLDGRTVAVRTDPGTTLDWATLGRVAFEVDSFDEAQQSGWSVVVHGVGRDVTEGIDEWSRRVRSRDLQPWAGGERHHWIAIASPTITGRRLHAAQETEALAQT